MLSILNKWASAICLVSGQLGAAIAAREKPNILFILTDDQDWHMQSLEHMPLLQKYLLNEGTLYANHFCTVALCCPSRVNLWSGRLSHNTNVTDVFPPYGGYPKIVREGINDDYLPIWLQALGYNTYYSGKLWNGHTVDNYNNPPAGGFNGSEFLLDPYTYEYWNGYMSRNGGPPVSYKDQYSPDVTAQKAYDFLEEATTHPDPWFLAVAPIASHSNVRLVPTVEMGGPQFADRHAHLFKDYKIPRTENFNPDEPSGVGWIKNLPRLNDTVVEYNDEFQRSRLRSLQSVDEMVEKMVKTLEQKGLLDNTYIFYTTDNGYHISQHRMHPGKECGYETDIHIPLLVRGPGVAIGKVTPAVTSHSDLSPTIMRLAGGYRDDFDGQPIPLTDEELMNAQPVEHVTVEGMAIPEGKFGKNGNDSSSSEFYNPVAARNNTYKALRLITPEYNIYYSVWCTGDKEFYDVKLEPGQLKNLLDSKHDASSYSIGGRDFPQVIQRLDALLMVLKSCKGNDCLQPWRALHPQGNVATLLDALQSNFDDFYGQQAKVSFSACELGQILESEGAQSIEPWSPSFERQVSGQQPLELRDEEPSSRSTFEYRGRWSDWT
ncbi:hypothetical protein G7054_g2552 [Neopestalotiopsis clavispora]|nr:hypothetical protein G7054_g2552 [Neopestalotiopsis clavispora]